MRSLRELGPDRVAEAVLGSSPGGAASRGLAMASLRVFGQGNEGIYTFLIRVEVAGQPDSYVLVTFNVGPKKGPQLLVPENRMQGVVLAPGQCPGNLAFNAALSGVKTAAQYAGQGFESQAATLIATGVR